jgi:hypothetical protein
MKTKLNRKERAEMKALHASYTTGTLSPLLSARYDDLLDREAAQTDFGREVMRKGGGPLVTVVQKPGYGATLSGRVGDLTKLIARHCSVGQRRARALLSAACERLELAADGDLENIGGYDVLEAAALIEKESV